MDMQKIYKIITGVILERIRDEVAKPGSSIPKVAARLGVAPSTIYRWLEGTRGQVNMGLRDALESLKKLGVRMEDVIHAVAPEQAEMLLALLVADSGLAADLAKIVARGGDDLEKVRAEISYVARKI